MKNLSTNILYTRALEIVELKKQFFKMLKKKKYVIFSRNKRLYIIEDLFHIAFDIIFVLMQ